MILLLVRKPEKILENLRKAFSVTHPMNRSSDEGLQKLNGESANIYGAELIYPTCNQFGLVSAFTDPPPLCIHQQLIEWNPPQCQHLQTQSNIQCRTFQRKFTLGFDFFNFKGR